MRRPAAVLTSMLSSALGLRQHASTETSTQADHGDKSVDAVSGVTLNALVTFGLILAGQGAGCLAQPITPRSVPRSDLDLHHGGTRRGGRYRSSAQHLQAIARFQVTFHTKIKLFPYKHRTTRARDVNHDS